MCSFFFNSEEPKLRRRLFKAAAGRAFLGCMFEKTRPPFLANKVIDTLPKKIEDPAQEIVILKLVLL